MTDAPVLEVATLYIVAGQEKAFEAAFQKARALLDAADGHVSNQLQRCTEDPGTYLLFIGWQTLAAHTVTFRESSDHDEWKRLLSPFYRQRASVVHCVPT